MAEAYLAAWGPWLHLNIETMTTKSNFSFLKENQKTKLALFPISLNYSLGLEHDIYFSKTFN